MTFVEVRIFNYDLTASFLLYLCIVELFCVDLHQLIELSYFCSYKILFFGYSDLDINKMCLKKSSKKFDLLCQLFANIIFTDNLILFIIPEPTDSTHSTMFYKMLDDMGLLGPCIENVGVLYYSNHSPIVCPSVCPQFLCAAITQIGF